MKDNKKLDKCTYCHNSFDGKRWFSSFIDGKHYKRIKCDSCGKEEMLEVDFEGSGHNGWDGTNAWKKDLKLKKKNDGKVKTLEDLVLKNAKRTKDI